MLEYVSLGILIVGATLVFYILIFIHDLPYVIAKKRNHPQVEAIHVACWLSLVTLHALWPLVFLWAVSKRPSLAVEVATTEQTAALEARIARLEEELRAFAAPKTLAEEGAENG